MDSIKVTFPHLGSACVPLEVLFTEGLGVEYIIPPPITARTLAVGSRFSPDYVCAPFKYNLGNYIESIEAGANTLVQVGGACRLGYYGELHEQIIKDLNYDVRFINTARASFAAPLTFYNELKSINPKMSLKKIAFMLPVAMKMLEYIEEAEDFIRKNIGFESSAGEFDAVTHEFVQALRRVTTRKQLDTVFLRHMKLLRDIPVKKPKDPLRVGIIGEYYTIMEPFSNHFMEKELAKMGMAVDRWMNLSNSILHNPMKKIKDKIKGYAKYDMGATAMMTVERALTFARRGYDGIIHVKSFGCTPEMDVIPVLQNISADYKIPILYFSFDSQTSETGVKTRLEAFYDMIIMRKDA